MHSSWNTEICLQFLQGAIEFLQCKKMTKSTFPIMGDVRMYLGLHNHINIGGAPCTEYTLLIALIKSMEVISNMIHMSFGQRFPLKSNG
jgi:hypothetical protein